MRRSGRQVNHWLLCCHAGVIITAVDSFVLLLIDRLGVRHLEAMFGVLVGVMAIAFGIMFADAGVDIGQVLEGEISPCLF